MKKREPISRIMTQHVFTIDKSSNLYEVRDLLESKKIRHVPVTENNKLVGMISKTDIMRLSFGGVFDNQEEANNAVFEMLNLEQVMRNSLHTVSSAHTIREVARIFAEEEFHALPVVDGETLVGIITTTDVIKYLLDQY